MDYVPFPGAPTTCAAFFIIAFIKWLMKFYLLHLPPLPRCKHLDHVLITLYVAKRSCSSIVKRMNGGAGGPRVVVEILNNGTRGVPISDRRKLGEVQNRSSLSPSPGTNIIEMGTMKVTELRSKNVLNLFFQLRKTISPYCWFEFQR